MILSDLQRGQSALISGIDINGNMRRRLLDMGFIPGSSISCVSTSPLGDPKAYMVKDTLIAVRNCEACRIHVTI